MLEQVNIHWQSKNKTATLIKVPHLIQKLTQDEMSHRLKCKTWNYKASRKKMRRRPSRFGLGKAAGWITSWNLDCWEKYQQPCSCRCYHSNGRKWRRTKEPLDEGERGEWKSWLRTQHLKMKIMASSPISWWQIDEETMETLRDFIFLGSKITADGDCSHEIKKMLAPWKKSYDKSRQYVRKQRHHFAYKGPYN